jgi:hypothetical protein
MNQSINPSTGNRGLAATAQAATAQRRLDEVKGERMLWHLVAKKPYHQWIHLDQPVITQLPIMINNAGYCIRI